MWGIHRNDPESLTRNVRIYRAAIELEEALRTVPVRFVATPVPVASVRHRSADGHETAPVMGEAQATA